MNDGGLVSLIIRLPFPDKSLMPNKQKGLHWAATYKARKAQKEAGYILTKQAMQSAGPQEWPDYIPISLLFLTPDRRIRDADSMHSASKHLLDGIAQAMGVDDSRFKPVILDWVLGPKEGGLIAAVGVSIQSSINIPV